MHYEAVKAGYRGQSYTIDDDDENKNPDSAYDLKRLKSKQAGGLGKEILHYGPPGGGNSGYQAINLAYMLGAKTVILLGFDMFGEHYFGRHPTGLIQDSPYKAFRASFETITEVEVINCTRETALTCFTRKRLEDVI